MNRQVLSGESSISCVILYVEKLVDGIIHDVWIAAGRWKMDDVGLE